MGKARVVSLPTGPAPIHRCRGADSGPSAPDSVQDSLRTPDPPLRADPRKPLACEKRSHRIWPCPPSPPSATHTDRAPEAQRSQLPGSGLPWRLRQAREGEGPQEPSLLLPRRGAGGAHHLCFVRCWVGVSMGGAAISMETWEPLRPVGKVGIGSQEGVSGKAPEGPPSSGQAEMLPGEPTAGVWQVGGRPGRRGRSRKAPRGLHLPAALRYHSSPLPFWDEQGSWRPREAGGLGCGGLHLRWRGRWTRRSPQTPSTAPRLLGRHLKRAGGPSHACTSPMTRTSHFWVPASVGRDPPTNSRP